MFSTLPAELVLDILGWLPIDTIRTLNLVCKHVRDFIEINEDIIYRDAAFRLGYIPSKDFALEDMARLYSPRIMRYVSTCKELCKELCYVSAAWKGRAPSAVRVSQPSLQDDVHRIKVDEGAGIVITSFNMGGISVCDLESGSLLWALSANYVSGYPHVEYENGFMIFNLRGRRKEVWKLVGSHPGLPRPKSSPVDSKQGNISRLMGEHYFDTYPRGHFQAWSAIEVPEQTYAFRFVYPTLLTAERHRLFLYDVKTGTLERDIVITEPEIHEPPHLTYVDISPHFIFACGWPSIRIVSRQTGKVLMDIASDKAHYSPNVYAMEKHTETTQGSALCVHRPYIRQPAWRQPEITHIYDQFLATHVSPCGRHLAILSMSSRLLILPFFERLWEDEPPPNITDIALEVELGSRERSSRYLAFDGSRVAVATDTGIFIVHLDLSRGAERILSVGRVQELDRPHALEEVSCLQMSQTALWLTWQYPYPEPQGQGRTNFDELLDEEVSYHVFNPTIPIGTINIRPFGGFDDLVQSTRKQVCRVDFARRLPGPLQREPTPEELHDADF